MTYNEFSKKIVEKLKEEMEGNPVITINDVPKNNGVIRRGLIIVYPGEDISPNIYLDEFYDEDIQENQLDSVVACIKTFYNQCRPKRKIDVSFYLDYEVVKASIFPKVVNEAMNQALLEQVPHYRFLDMQVVFYCRVSDSEIGQGSILVRKEHLGNWDITEEELFMDAYNNLLKQEKIEMVNITSILEEMLNKPYLSLEEKESLQNDIDRMKTMCDALPMHVISNQERTYGAAAILNEEYLYNLSKSFDSDFYILPSSIHELILIPLKTAAPVWELKDMVKSVNETAVDREELLSDSVYLFSKSEKRVMIAM